LNKSSLILRMQKLNARTLEQFTKIIKIESTYKNN